MWVKFIKKYKSFKIGDKALLTNDGAAELIKTGTAEHLKKEQVTAIENRETKVLVDHNNKKSKNQADK